MSNRTCYASTYVVADGVTRTWPFSFAGVNTGQESGTTPYLYPEDVKVQELYTDDAGVKQVVTRTGVLTAPNQITIDGPAVQLGREIRIYRYTELRFPLVDYRDLQSVSEHDLDLANRQAIFVTQETRDVSSSSLLTDPHGNFDAKGRRIINAAPGRDPVDAVNMSQYSRTLRVPEDEGIPELTTAADRAGKVLMFDQAGLPMLQLPMRESALALEIALRDAGDPLNGTGMVGVTPRTPGALPTTVHNLIVRDYNVMDVLTPAEQADVISRSCTIDLNKKLQKLFDEVPAGSRIVIPNGTYFNDGPVGLEIRKSLCLDFQRGAVLQFNHNDASYLATLASNISLLNPSIDGGSRPEWLRKSHAGIRVRTTNVAGTSVSGIEIIRPRISNVAAAGIVVGWTYPVSDVTIDNPVIRNTKADGVSITYGASDVSVISPRCFDTGDDGVSIVSYQSAPNPIRNVAVTDALSVNSHARGLTVIGGEDITMSGKSINARVQGILVLQDVGKYLTYPPKRVTLDVASYNAGGIGIEIGRNATDISGTLRAVGAKGSRGILVGSGAGLEPLRCDFSLLTAFDCDGFGVELGLSKQTTVGAIGASLNGLAGVLAANTTNVAIGSIVAYNNNTRAVAGVDNIFFSGVKNFTVSSVTSTDDRAVPTIERTFDIATSTNGVIGSFNGVRGTAVNVAPNVQSSCVNVRLTAIAVNGIGVPTVAMIPNNGHYLDVSGRAVYYNVNGVPMKVVLSI